EKKISREFESKLKTDKIVNMNNIKEKYLVVVYKLSDIEEFKIFANYESFKEYLVKNEIIEENLRVSFSSKNKRLITILKFLEAHVRSYFYILETGYKYSNLNNIYDLDFWRLKNYEEDFVVWFQEMNKICKEFFIKYIWTFTDLEYYAKEHL
ncbi:24162_t:CDS:2, partial [Gigaspora margarita]